MNEQKIRHLGDVWDTTPGRLQVRNFWKFFVTSTSPLWNCVTERWLTDCVTLRRHVSWIGLFSVFLSRLSVADCFLLTLYISSCLLFRDVCVSDLEEKLYLSRDVTAALDARGLRVFALKLYVTEPGDVRSRASFHKVSYPCQLSRIMRESHVCGWHLSHASRTIPASSLAHKSRQLVF